MAACIPKTPVLYCALIIDCLSFCVSFTCGILLITACCTTFSHIKVFGSQVSSDTVQYIYVAAIAGGIIFTLFSCVSLVCLIFSLSLVLPEWSLPFTMLKMKRAAIGEYLQTICDQGLEAAKAGGQGRLGSRIVTLDSLYHERHLDDDTCYNSPTYNSYQADPTQHVHQHNHYYHQANPVVKVPVAPKPYVVQVPQNVPVHFVPVNVPTRAPQYQTVPVHLVPQHHGYKQQYQVHNPDSECYAYDFDCLGKIGRDFGLPIPQSQSRYPRQQAGDEYVKRKEIAKSALLLGAGVLKGALITTLINQVQNNNGK